MGYDVLQELETPRSTVAHLESNIAQLEINLARLKSEKAIDTMATANAAIKELTARLVVAAGEPWKSKATHESANHILSLSSPSFLSQSPLPGLRDRSQDSFQQDFTASPTRNSTISSIPRNVVDIMLRNYCQIYLPQYPVVDESSLYESCERIYANADPSFFDLFSIAITLAISVSFPVSYSPENPISREKHG
jgi:hypothetical protein